MIWDGKMYDKYRIEHTDGTPLKGKKYFVLRLDSDNTVEAARVAAAMRAYKGDLRNCDVGTAEEQCVRWRKFCDKENGCDSCACNKEKFGISADCFAKWAQMPCEEGGGLCGRASINP